MRKRAMRPEAISEALWPRVSAVIASHTGLHFPNERRKDLQRGLADAAIELGFDDVSSCAEWLLSAELTKPQLDTLASHLTIGETYFFRERKAFEALATQVLPPLIHKRRGTEQRLRLWSAACSTGEEAYSLAILVQQVLPDWRNWQVSILATDINNRFLKKAVSGVYGEWSFRDSSPELKSRYFERTAEGRYSVVPDVRSRVRFAQLNLAQDGFPSLATDTNAMDIVFCRNMLIYFEPSQARLLVEKLRHAILDDGWLAVSPSECSQTLFRGFQAVNFPGAVLYQKRSPDAPMTHAVESPALEMPAWAAPEPQRLFAHGEYALAASALICSISSTIEATPRETPARRSPPEDFALLTRSLANEGRLDDALAWSERWIAADKLDPVAHYLHAMVLQELGNREHARRSLQRAIYIEPGFALAHFALGNLAGRGAGQRHFENALSLLSRLPPQQIVPESDGLTAGRLTEIIVALSPARAATSEKAPR
jgi:chemotaxis protein methyltransferase CheR